MANSWDCEASCCVRSYLSFRVFFPDGLLTVIGISDKQILLKLKQLIYIFNQSLFQEQRFCFCTQFFELVVIQRKPIFIISFFHCPFFSSPRRCHQMYKIIMGVISIIDHLFSIHSVFLKLNSPTGRICIQIL